MILQQLGGELSQVTDESVGTAGRDFADVAFAAVRDSWPHTNHRCMGVTQWFVFFIKLRAHFFGDTFPTGTFGILYQTLAFLVEEPFFSILLDNLAMFVTASTTTGIRVIAAVLIGVLHSAASIALATMLSNNVQPPRIALAAGLPHRATLAIDAAFLSILSILSSAACRNRMGVFQCRA